MYRYPKDTPSSSRRFYQEQYREGMTTEMPDDYSLERLKASVFRGTEKDISEKILVLKALMPRGRVLDYGCSWGYGTFQLVAAGYDAVGFEISEDRAEFARSRLGVNVIFGDMKLDKMAGSFDAIFASHVFEHLPTPSAVFDLLAALLKPAGLLLAFVPNCGGDVAQRLGVRWGPMCCEKHTLALNREFLERALPKHGFKVSIFFNPYDCETVKDDLNHPAPRDLGGEELMICARKLARRHAEVAGAGRAAGG